MVSLGRENGHVMVVVSLKEGEWSNYRGGHKWRGEWFCYRGGLFNGGGFIMLERWVV